jgi:hypothetical protein
MGCMLCLSVMIIFDMEGYDASNACHVFELKLHSLKDCQKWKVYAMIGNSPISYGYNYILIKLCYRMICLLL